MMYDRELDLVQTSFRGQSGAPSFPFVVGSLPGCPRSRYRLPVLRVNLATDQGTQTKAKHPEEYAPKDRTSGGAWIGAKASAALFICSRTHDEPDNPPAVRPINAPCLLWDRSPRLRWKPTRERRE